MFFFHDLAPLFQFLMSKKSISRRIKRKEEKNQKQKHKNETKKEEKIQNNWAENVLTKVQRELFSFSFVPFSIFFFINFLLKGKTNFRFPYFLCDSLFGKFLRRFQTQWLAGKLTSVYTSSYCLCFHDDVFLFNCGRRSGWWKTLMILMVLEWKIITFSFQQVW